MKKFAAIAAVVLASISAGSASAETFRFPADRVNMGVSQVDIGMSVYLHPDCSGRWSLDYPAGFTFSRGGLNGGNLRGNPGKGTYDIAVQIKDCTIYWPSGCVFAGEHPVAQRGRLLISVHTLKGRKSSLQSTNCIL